MAPPSKEERLVSVGNGADAEDLTGVVIADCGLATAVDDRVSANGRREAASKQSPGRANAELKNAATATLQDGRFGS